MAKIHFQTQQGNLKCAAADVATAKKKKGKRKEKDRKAEIKLEGNEIMRKYELL